MCANKVIHLVSYVLRARGHWSVEDPEVDTFVCLFMWFYKVPFLPSVVRNNDPIYLIL